MSFKFPPLLFTNNCFNCNIEFVFWRGRFRHHCRLCGNNFCANCLPINRTLPQIGILKEVRMCDSCYGKYNLESDDEFFEASLFEDEFGEKEEENAQCSKCDGDDNDDDDDVIEARQLAIAISLSKIENIVSNYATSTDTEMSEEEEIRVALKLSEMEEKARQYASGIGKPVNTSTSEKGISCRDTSTTINLDLSEEDELALALAISKIEEEDTINETETKQNPTQSRQMNCPICFEERLEYALVQCGHVVCGDCKPQLQECPICRAPINGAIRIYITD